MDRADYPAFETADDDLDALLGTTGAGLARSFYAGQKADLALVLSRLRTSPSVKADCETAADLLHRVAGTAAYFDDVELGRIARTVEQSMIDAAPADVIALCDQLLPLCEAH